MKKIVPLLFFIVAMNFSFVAFAQEASDNKYTYAKIGKISEKEIVLKVDNYQSGKADEVVFSIADNVRLRKVKSLNDLKPGDPVEVLYKEEKGKKTALMILLAKE